MEREGKRDFEHLPSRDCCSRAGLHTYFWFQTDNFMTLSAHSSLSQTLGKGNFFPSCFGCDFDIALLRSHPPVSAVLFPSWLFHFLCRLSCPSVWNPSSSDYVQEFWGKVAPPEGRGGPSMLQLGQSKETSSDPPYARGRD